MEKKNRVLIANCLHKIGEVVLLSGWVQTVRKHGKIAFFDLKDRSGVLQIGAFGKDLADIVATLNPQDVVSVNGKVKKREERYINRESPFGSIELEMHDLHVITKAAQLPFDMGGKELNVELPTLLDHRTLALRHSQVAAIFKIQETIVQSFRETLQNEGFTEIFVPTLVPVATEGGAEVFPVDYYQHKAYLAQSPQLYKQMMVSIFERVLTVAHAYRAEPSVTTRHLSEYVSLDAELGFIDSFHDIMDVVEKVVRRFFDDIVKDNEYELRLLEITLPVVSKQFPRITMREAQNILYRRTGRDHRSEMDLDPMDEKDLCLWANEQTGAPFVFVTHFPTKKRPFYTMPDPKNPEYSLSFDLLGYNEEWVTGGQRINDYQTLVSRIKEKGSKTENFALYLQAFKYGMPPEGGFAMGLERLTKDIIGLSNVREASLFPRDMERVDERFSVLEETSDS